MVAGAIAQGALRRDESLRAFVCNSSHLQPSWGWLAHFKDPNPTGLAKPAHFELDSAARGLIGMDGAGMQQDTGWTGCGMGTCVKVEYLVI